jgi:hypothetical protein
MTPPCVICCLRRSILQSSGDRLGTQALGTGQCGFLFKLSSGQSQFGVSKTCRSLIVVSSTWTRRNLFRQPFMCGIGYVLLPMFSAPGGPGPPRSPCLPCLGAIRGIFSRKLSDTPGSNASGPQPCAEAVLIRISEQTNLRILMLRG